MELYPGFNVFPYHSSLFTTCGWTETILKLHYSAWPLGRVKTTTVHAPHAGIWKRSSHIFVGIFDMFFFLFFVFPILRAPLMFLSIEQPLYFFGIDDSLPFCHCSVDGWTNAPELEKYVMPPHTWPAKSLTRCGRPLLYHPSLRLRLSHRFPSAAPFQFPTSHFVPAHYRYTSRFERFSAPFGSYPRASFDVCSARPCSRFACSLSISFSISFSYLCASSSPCYGQYWLPLLCSGGAHVGNGCIWDNSFRLRWALRVFYTRL